MPEPSALTPRPLEVRATYGGTIAAVGHGEACVSLVVIMHNGAHTRAAMVIKPDEARELAVLLIEQAGHADQVALTEQENRNAL